MAGEVSGSAAAGSAGVTSNVVGSIIAAVVGCALAVGGAVSVVASQSGTAGDNANQPFVFYGSENGSQTPDSGASPSPTTSG